MTTKEIDHMAEIMSGLGLTVRSFMVDYKDRSGEYYHKPLQGIYGGDIPDETILERIKQDIGEEYEIYSIVEIVSENVIKMSQLEDAKAKNIIQRLGDYVLIAWYLSEEAEKEIELLKGLMTR